jgi:hypothetical protein
MRCHDPYVVLNDQQRAMLDKKATQKAANRDHEFRVNFVMSLLDPPDELELPPDPEIPPLEAFTLHRDVVPRPISGPVLSWKQMDSIPAIVPDDDAELMTPVQSS